jgi:hypothetical protein
VFSFQLVEYEEPRPLSLTDGDEASRPGEPRTTRLDPYIESFKQPAWSQLSQEPRTSLSWRLFSSRTFLGECPSLKVYNVSMKHSVELYENSVYIKEINTRPLSLGRHTQTESIVYWYSIQ